MKFSVAAELGLRAANEVAAETLAERVEAQAQEPDRIWKLSQDLRGVILNVDPACSATLAGRPNS